MLMHYAKSFTIARDSAASVSRITARRTGQFQLLVSVSVQEDTERALILIGVRASTGINAARAITAIAAANDCNGRIGTYMILP